MWGWGGDGGGVVEGGGGISGNNSPIYREFGALKEPLFLGAGYFNIDSHVLPIVRNSASKFIFQSRSAVLYCLFICLFVCCCCCLVVSYFFFFFIFLLHFQRNILSSSKSHPFIG